MNASGAPDHGSGSEDGPDGMFDSWWWRWGMAAVVTVLGWVPVLPLAVMGWVALGGAHGVSIAGAPPDQALGTLLWAGSAFALVGPGCMSSYRLWPLRHRLAVAVPVGLAWFLVGRFVLPGGG